MTKEQEEAIDRLRKITNRQILYGNKYGIVIEEFKKLQEDIETVLNLLKQKDAEIEKKDKMIDLMAEELKKYIFVLYDGDTITSKKGIIQNYERKVEDGRL